MNNCSSNMHVVIMGAGPAGITAGVELDQKGVACTLLEKASQPGGLSKTVAYKGYRFDIGGHRFYTKIPEIQQWWQNMLGDEFLTRNRLSRIYYNRHCLDYPLQLTNILKELGPIFCLRAFASYVYALIKPRKPETSFEDWVSNHFGRMLYREFFKSYTEKVWGIPCHELSAAWASQRIKGLSFWSVVRSLLVRPEKNNIKSLIRQFQYPRLGPGQMWERAINQLQLAQVHYNETVCQINWKKDQITAIHTKDLSGKQHIHVGSHFLSTIAMKDLVAAMPDVPANIRRAADQLNYRDFITVALIISKPDINPDNWLYIHDERVKVGRIQNFKNWSPDMVPDAHTTCLGLEYFCTKNDTLWSANDDTLIAMAKDEIALLGLANQDEVTDAKVVRVEQAYPVYNADYKAHVQTVREFLAQFSNLQLIGRNGMHQYNNQDHAMMTAMLATRNILGESHDVWKVNASAEYGETG